MADLYRKYAAECLSVAQQIQNPNEKAMLLEMAQMWQRLAEKAVGEEPDKDSEAPV